jgi:predicted DNA-binding transcriptional regulator AlpA
MRLLTRNEAAALCRVSPSTFDRHVRPWVRARGGERKAGACVRFREAVVGAWVRNEAQQNASAESLGLSGNEHPAESGTFVCRQPRVGEKNQPESETIAWLQSKRAEFTRKSSQTPNDVRSTQPRELHAAAAKRLTG